MPATGLDAVTCIPAPGLSCYHLSTDSLYTHAECVDYCSERRAALACIQSADESAKVTSKLNNTEEEASG